MFAPYVMAQEKGYFAEEGIDLEIVQIGAAISVKALIGGDHQVDGAGASAMAAILQGAPLRLVMIQTERLPWWIFAKPGINSIPELKGKRMGTPTLGSALDITAGMLLKKSGVDPQKDVVWIATGVGANMITAIKAGAIDAGVFDDSAAFQAKQEGLTELAWVGKEFDIVTGGLATTEKLIKEKPDLLKRFVRAGLKGYLYFKAQSPQAIESFTKYSGLEPKKAKEYYDLSVTYSTTTGVATDEALKLSLDIQKQASGVKEDFSIGQVWDLRLAKQAGEELKAEGWKPK
ncbi:MAG: ABC transporter substrate-binding protein [Dehalococcoidia bacterium]|nr:ABC transporter substrate-binding protein [Dehalococcoidia bacterium]